MRPLTVFATFLTALSAADTLRVTLPVKTETSGVWKVAKAFADIPPGAVSPALVSAPQSSQTKAPAAASMSVSFDIDATGLPFNIQVAKSSDKDIDDEVIAMIREWRFEAARNGGVGVPSRAYIDLSIGAALPPPTEGRRPVHKNRQ
jgi:TonB family protein